MSNNKKVQSCAALIRNFLPTGFRPRVGLALGTGLGGMAGGLRTEASVPYASLPDYPLSTVPSHSGRFSVGHLGATPVIMQEGRCHLYEGCAPEEVVMGVRIMAELGAEALIVTNAAGALNPLFSAGEIMLITDQINFTGRSPLTGLADTPGRSRFVDMSEIYDPALLALAVEQSLRLGFVPQRGVFLGLSGPQMESRAETRMFRAWGADAVGMSTVLEVIAARHLGLRVLGLCALSNKNMPDCMAETSLEEIIRVAGQAAERMEKLIAAVLERLSITQHGP
ncbi:MAG: purine-nucleoside phosphorylase, partial [Deltaproteobacteria bacterium]|nr:purine-nucleoside phosphorylase [Deltaproteobacteria bacterium]